MNNRPDNRLLQTLSDNTFVELSSFLEAINLEPSDRLWGPDGPVDFIWFPISCLLAVMTTADDGTSIQNQMIGSEGAVGVLETLGSGSAATEVKVLIAGAAMRVRSQDFKALVWSHPDLMTQCHLLLELQMAEARQSALCFALHGVRERFSNFLLETADRSGGNLSLKLTQELSALALRVQRTTITTVAQLLQDENLISYKRGLLKIENYSALSGTACGCRYANVARRKQLKLEPIV